MTIQQEGADNTKPLTVVEGRPWLKPWQPGKSANPGGKSKKLEEIKSLAKDKSKRALERIIELVESDDERIALMAAKEVLDRAWGKPKESDEDGPKGAVTINIVKYSDGNHAPAQLEPASVSVRTVEVPGGGR